MHGNRVTRLFGTTYPIVSGGMVWCSGWRLASAVSNAGGLGLIGAGSMSIDVFRTHVDRCAAAVATTTTSAESATATTTTTTTTPRPYGVNLPLYGIDAAPYVEYAIEKRVPIVVTSAGSPRTWTSTLQSHGIRVAHVVPSGKLARKCCDAGVDAVIAEGFEAGGHDGVEELTTLTLVPLVRAAIGNDMPLIAAGGVASGAAMLAVMALGADGVQVGTRFALTVESRASDAYKQRCVHCGEAETRLTMKQCMPTRLLLNTYGKAVEQMSVAGATREAIMAFRGRGRTRRGIFDGDVEQGELDLGQVASTLSDIPHAAEVVQRMVREYNARREQLAQCAM